MKIRTSILAGLLLGLFLTASVQAAFLPYFGDIRTEIVARQVAISNAPPITPAARKQLTALSTALKTVDKVSTSLNTDVKNLALVVQGINRGASNAIFLDFFQAAVGQYKDVLVSSNQALLNLVSNANNNPALKAKAMAAVSNAVAAVGALDENANINKAAAGLAGALTKILTATKAVTVAVNAPVAPIPNPPLGKMNIVVDGQMTTFSSMFFVRGQDGVMITGNDSKSFDAVIILNLPANKGAGDYGAQLTFRTIIQGVATGCSLTVTNCHVTAASASTVSGNMAGTGHAILEVGGPLVPVNVSCRFNAKKPF